MLSEEEAEKNIAIDLRREWEFQYSYPPEGKRARIMIATYIKYITFSTLCIIRLP